MLTHQQADFSRFQRKNLFFNAAGKIPGKNKQRDQQQHGGDEDINDLCQRDAIEITGQVAHGDDAHNPAGGVEDRRLAAQRHPEPSFTDSGDTFPFQHRLVITAHQPGTDPLRVDGMKQMYALRIANDNKARVAAGGDFLHK